ncbi:hypothetical protein FBU59_002441 [Linderina macrospora]|uniref:Uncharacterized protein n=1 Tax=Linderina macrospora TaxID=4868 RepID=A0ACC1JB48_9FUNG|nr:hypothetical protein FBU59_002441 [Linderina macrospora]
MNDDYDDDAFGNGSSSNTQTGHTPNERIAIDIARYALAAHASQKPLRRDALRSFFKDTSARHFKTSLDRANELLQLHFGLAMVPYPVREKKSTDAPTQGAASKPVTRWALQSTLPQTCRQELQARQAKEERELMGFVAAVLSLVLVSNMGIGMDQLVLYVRKLGPPTHLAALAAATADGGSRISASDAIASDAQLDSLAREAIAGLVRRGYLDKIAPRTASASQAGGGNDDANNDDDSGVELTWGPQAKVEFQPIDITRFIAATTGQECSAEFVKKIGRAFGRNIDVNQ